MTGLLALGLLALAAPRVPNSNCEWPQGIERPLTEDAEFAEDLAIRYADRCCGPHSGHFESFAEYGRMRDQCMARLFQEVAGSHTVSVEQVRESLRHRSTGLDLAVILSFGVLYAFAAHRIARWVSGAVMIVYASAIVSIAGVLLLELWAITVETIRVGNGHLSDRTGRIPWAHHRPALFVGGVLLFWLAAALPYRFHFLARLSKSRGARASW